MKRVLLAVAVVIIITGCGGGGDDERVTVAVEGVPTTPVETTAVRVYWLRDGKVWPALREVPRAAVGGQTLGALNSGPTEREKAELDFSSALPESMSFQMVIAKRVAEISSSAELSDEALAQLVYTVTQFPTVESVEIEGKSYTRADFEDMTPAILVESPLPFEEITSPLRVTGTANTFEANFSYELTDTDGLIIAEHFVTATSGTGTRGTFELTVPFEVKFDGVGSLIVFEPSAKDGSRTNLVEIPIRMKQ